MIRRPPMLVADGVTLGWDQLPAACAHEPLAWAPSRTVPDVLRLLASLNERATVALLHPRWSPAEVAAAERAIARHPLAKGTVLLFTSGSSGAPKGVRLSHDALAAAATAHARALPFEPDDRWLLSMPVAHMGGLGILARCMAARATVVLDAGGAFAPARFARRIDEARVTLASIVPTMLARLVEARVEAPAGLRAVLLGGAAVSPETLARGRALGWPLLPTYGATETCGQVCTQRLGDERAGGVGPPLPGLAVSVEADRIQVDGPTLMRGYLGEPDLAAPLAMPDRGRLDGEGHLHVEGRADLMIQSGGELVDPLEVEAALGALAAVQGPACVVGVPDPRWGERVVAVLAGPAPSLALAELRALLADRLAAYKHPRAIVHVAELPLLASGKLDRTRARRMAGVGAGDRATRLASRR